MRGLVALILALCVFAFFASGIIIRYMTVVGFEYESQPMDADMAAQWVDAVKILIGGLIAYIANRKGDS